jgi:type II secretory pathway component PulK
MKRTPSDRRAVLVISVLASLALVMLLAGSWLRVIALERRQLAAQQHRLQAEYLAEAALARAAARLATNPDYAGETMSPTAESLSSAAGANVTIRVQRVDADPQARAVTVSAEYPAGGRDLAVRSKEQTIHLLRNEPTP